MSTRKHAILGPSSASKWLTCTPSARLELTLPEKQSDAADEGTLAHSLGELIISHLNNAITNKKFREQLAAIESNKFYNKAMYEYADGYARYVLERYGAAKLTTPDAILVLEQELDLSKYVPEGFGTGDAGIIADGVLEIVDLKYGKGVEVSAIDNSQLKIYALGWLTWYDWLYDIHTVRMTIYQPRMNNISVFEIGRVKLMRWAEDVLIPRAAIAFRGEGEFAAGKHCQFCRAKVTCKANAAYQVETVGLDFDKADDKAASPSAKDIATLTPDRIVWILQRAEAFNNYLNSVKAYALEQALAGVKWPGLKLVSGRSTRKITDVPKVEKLLIKDGFDRTKIYKPQELIGITEMEKLMGKKTFDLLVAPYTVKAPGAPALVDANDKRPEFNTASDDFENVDELG